MLNEGMAKLGAKGAEAVDAWLEDHGVFKLKGGKEGQTVIISNSEVGILSDPGNITIRDIDAYFDSVAKKYIVRGFWDWRKIEYVDSKAGSIEGVGLAMSKTDGTSTTGQIFSSNPAGIAVYDQDGYHYTDVGNAAKISKSGVAYTFQDRWMWLNKYVGYSGQVWFYLDQRPLEDSVYITMTFEHTWEETYTSTEYGLSWGGSYPEIYIKWNNNIAPKNWTAVNQHTEYQWERQ